MTKKKKIYKLLILTTLCLGTFFSAPFIFKLNQKSPVMDDRSFDAYMDLTVGWYPTGPFQYPKKEYGQMSVSGLDVEILKAIARTVNINLSFKKLLWDDQLEKLKSGEIDLMIGALSTKKRRENYYFSIPYREEKNTLFIDKELSINGDRYNISKVIKDLKERKFRLGLVGGYTYHNSLIRDYIEDPLVQKNFLISPNAQKNISALLEGKVDGILSDPITIRTTLWRKKMQNEVKETDLLTTQNIHFIFSKKSVSVETVERINRAIHLIKNNGTFKKVNRFYIFPMILAQTLESPWYYFIEMLGICAFAVSGLLIASRYKYDISGALVMGSLPTIGGGVIRDLLTGRTPVSLLENPIYMFAILLITGGGFLLIQIGNYLYSNKIEILFMTRNRFRKVTNIIIEVCDAIGLAAFVVTGVVVALGTQIEPLWLWGPFMAMLNGSGGGILRDMVLSDPNFPTLKGEIYAEIALVWGLFLSLFLTFQMDKIDPDAIFSGIIVTLIGIFITRLTVLFFNLRSPKYYIANKK